jgi:hypothetical protein
MWSRKCLRRSPASSRSLLLNASTLTGSQSPSGPGPIFNEQVTATRYDLHQQLHDLRGRFVMVVRYVAPGIAHGDAGFPWMIQRGFGHLLLGSGVVFKFPGYGAVNYDKAGLFWRGPWQQCGAYQYPG